MNVLFELLLYGFLNLAMLMIGLLHRNSRNYSNPNKSQLLAQFYPTLILILLQLFVFYLDYKFFLQIKSYL
jgi:hypothetical protein